MSNRRFVTEDTFPVQEEEYGRHFLSQFSKKIFKCRFLTSVQSNWLKGQKSNVQHQIERPSTPVNRGTAMLSNPHEDEIRKNKLANKKKTLKNKKNKQPSARQRLFFGIYYVAWSQKMKMYLERCNPQVKTWQCSKVRYKIWKDTTISHPITAQDANIYQKPINSSNLSVNSSMICIKTISLINCGNITFKNCLLLLCFRFLPKEKTTSIHTNILKIRKNTGET